MTYFFRLSFSLPDSGYDVELQIDFSQLMNQLTSLFVLKIQLSQVIYSLPFFTKSVHFIQMCFYDLIWSEIATLLQPLTEEKEDSNNEMDFY